MPSSIGESRTLRHTAASDWDKILPRELCEPKCARAFGNNRSVALAKTKYIAINIFLVVHILTVTVWCIPLDTPLVPLCRNLLRPYFLWSGLFQSWDMFCPIPKSANTYVEAIVIYRDGSEKTWTFPRMEQLSLRERYFKERYRKFAENLPLEQNRVFWADVARHIARVNNTASNPVKTVVLIEELSPIIIPLNGSYAPQPWQQYIWYGYAVRPEDLK